MIIFVFFQFENTYLYRYKSYFFRTPVYSISLQRVLFGAKTAKTVLAMIARLALFLLRSQSDSKGVSTLVSYS